jgi:hypothetical protein
MRDAIEEFWPMVDTDGSGLVDEHELAAFMNGTNLSQRKRGLAQILRGKGCGDAAAVIDHCDKNGDSMLSKEEVFNCIKSEVPAEYHDDVKAAIDEIWP